MTTSRREARRLERRAAIVAVARDHFFEHGYGNTSMSAIAAELGGSKGTLWSYFPSKEALFAAVMEATAEEFRRELDFPAPGGDPVATLTRLCCSLIDRVVSPMALSMLRLVTAEAGRFPEIGRLFFDRGPGRTQQMIADYLADNLAEELGDIDFADAARMLMALCSWGIFYDRLWGLIEQPSNEEKETEARRAAELFLRAYRREDGGASLQPRRSISGS